jgi:hypothetical protein
VAFQEWRRSALARLDRGEGFEGGGGAVGTVPTPGADGAAEPGPQGRPAVAVRTRLLPELAPPVTLPRATPEPAAEARWQRVLAVVQPQLSMLDYFGVEDAVPVGGDAAALVLAVSNDIAARALQRSVPRLAEVLAAHEGRPVEIRIVSAFHAAVPTPEPASASNDTTSR